MAGRSPRPQPVLAPQRLTNPRTLTPTDQLNRHYGGRAGMEEALLNSEELARQLSAIEGFDPEGNYRAMFPEIDYSKYGDDVLINPVPEESTFFEGSADDPDARRLAFTRQGLYPPDTGMVSLPDQVRPDGTIEMIDGSLGMVPDEAFELPSISYQTDIAPGTPGQMPKQQFEQLGQISRSIEEPMTDYVTMSDKEIPLAYGAEPGEFQEPLSGPRKMGSMIDALLAQIRRSRGDISMDPGDARRMISDSVGGSFALDANEKMVPRPRNEIDGMTGLNMGQLQMLASLPLEVQAKLPARLRELVSTLGPVGAGLMSQGGQQQNPQGINPQATMGPLGGLMN